MIRIEIMKIVKIEVKKDKKKRNKKRSKQRQKQQKITNNAFKKGDEENEGKKK